MRRHDTLKRPCPRPDLTIEILLGVPIASLKPTDRLKTSFNDARNMSALLGSV
jgi:hypothetical protein